MTTETQEKPILFSGPMVQAILDGRKTQTRLVVKPQPYKDGEYPDGVPMYYWESKILDAGYCHTAIDACERIMAQCCPYSVGDRLWVRETWAPCSTFDPSEETGAIYRAEPWRNGQEPSVKWRPSIHMPRWASRITLEVTGVRVERLREISEADAQKEGVEPGCLTCGENCTEHGGCGYCRPAYRDSFVWLWNTINGPGSWEANPWVWVVEFKRAEATA